MSEKTDNKIPNVPNLRFDEFKEKWLQSKLNNICEINPKTDKLADKFIYIDLESVEKGVLIKKNIIDKVNVPSEHKEY